MRIGAPLEPEHTSADGVAEIQDEPSHRHRTHRHEANGTVVQERHVRGAKLSNDGAAKVVGRTRTLGHDCTRRYAKSYGDVGTRSARGCARAPSTLRVAVAPGPVAARTNKLATSD